MVQRPTWEGVTDQPEYPSLTAATTTDVLIIGGGITGVITAYLLAKSGRKITLIEQGTIASGATGYTTAFQTQAVDTNLTDLVRLFGAKAAQTVWQSGHDVIEWYEQTITRENIDCEFVRCPNYLYANQPSDLAELAQELDLARSLGFQGTLFDHPHLSLPIAGAVEMPNQAKFHPTKFLSALAKRAHKLGVAIHEHTTAQSVQGVGPFTVTTPRGTITATDLVVATYAPFHNPRQVRAKKGAYTTYVYELELARESLPEAIYEDVENPYHYFRVDRLKDHDRVILGGEDHRQELNGWLEKKSFERLKQYADTLFSGFDHRITRRWSGQILEPIDGLPSIGAIAPHHYVATGFSGTGMTYGAIAGQIFVDGILERKNQWASVYDPMRPLTLKALATKGRDYIEEFWNGVVAKLFTR